MSATKFDLPEEDLVMIESLVKSPAFGALKRLLNIYRQEALGVLKSSDDTHRIFQTQGRLIGMDIIENLPSLTVAQWRERQKVAEARAKEEAARNKRLKRQDPRPPVR